MERSIKQVLHVAIGNFHRHPGCHEFLPILDGAIVKTVIVEAPQLGSIAQRHRAPRNYHVNTHLFTGEHHFGVLHRTGTWIQRQRAAAMGIDKSEHAFAILINYDDEAVVENGSPTTWYVRWNCAIRHPSLRGFPRLQEILRGLRDHRWIADFQTGDQHCMFLSLQGGFVKIGRISRSAP